MAAFVTSLSHGADPIDTLVSAYIQMRPITNEMAELPLDEAYVLQRRYVQTLASRFGPRRGFKAALTSPSSQHHFGIAEPLYGQLFDEMLLSSPAKLPVSFGARGLIEADLLVRVGDSGINDVADPREVLLHLDAVIPFIELPDPLWSVSLTASRLVVANCGARYGVMGDPVLLGSGEQWSQRLSAIRVDLYGPDERLVASGVASSLMGDPLNVVWWLVQRLNRDGIVLKPGDLLSLGSLTAPVAPESGRYRADYRGLSVGENQQGVATVSVEFIGGKPGR